MAGKKKDPSDALKPSARQQRMLDILNAPPSREMVELLNPKTPLSTKTTQDSLAILKTPVSAEIIQAFKGTDENFARFKAMLLPDTNTASSLSPGEEFVELTPEQILKRPALTEMEILTATPSPEIIAALGNKDGSDKIYMGGASLQKYLERGGVPAVTSFKMMPLDQAQRDISQKYLGIIAETQPGELHPLLLKRMSKDPEVAMLVNYAIQAGNREGINGIMYANQLWQESRFNPDAVSPKGAAGIAQMMPFHQGKYGLNNRDDFFDEYKSIDAGAKMMFEMTDKYKDQRLALAAYNGGQGAIDFVEKKLGKSQITFGDWYGFMQNRRSTNPSNDPSAWQNETKNYVDVIAGKPALEDIKKARGPEPFRP